MGLREIARLVLVVAAAAAGGCAATGAARAPAPAGPYGTAEVHKIIEMRMDGQSRAAVVRVVGGTQEDVRLAETQERARRRSGALLAEMGR